MTIEQEDQQLELASPSASARWSVSPWIKIILLFTVVCVGLSAYMALRWREASRHELQALRSKLSVMKTQQEAASTRLDSTLKNMHAVDEHTDLLDKQLKTLLRSQPDRANDWVLLKARYYLELAQINAVWGRDIQVTSDLLEHADTLLKDLHDQGVLDVRRAIAQEIAAVKAVEPIDVAGLLSQLDAAQDLTRSLVPLLIPGQMIDHNAIPSDSKTEMRGWRARLQESLHALKTLVVIRRTDADVQPFATPAYVALLRERIQLGLEETQLAVLQGNEALFQLTLKQVIKRIHQSFDLQDPNTIALLKQLDELQQRTVAHQKMDIGQALLLLNQTIDVEQDKKPETGASAS